MTQIDLFEENEEFKDLNKETYIFDKSGIMPIDPIFRADLDGRHYYRHDPQSGKPIFYRSVTTIINQETNTGNSIELALLKMNHKHTLEWFAQRGTLVHILMNMMIEHEIMALKLDNDIGSIIEQENLYELNVSDSLIRFVQKALLAGAKWIKDYQVETMAIEPIVYDDDQATAGALDNVCTLIDPSLDKGRIAAVVDYKASKYTNVKDCPDSYSMQLRAYFDMWNKLHPEFLVQRRYNLCLGKDWKTWSSPYSCIDQTNEPRQMKWFNILKNNQMLPQKFNKKKVIEGVIDLNNLKMLEETNKSIDVEEYYKRKEI